MAGDTDPPRPALKELTQNEVPGYFTAVKRYIFIGLSHLLNSTVHLDMADYHYRSFDYKVRPDRYHSTVRIRFHFSRIWSRCSITAVCMLSVLR